MLRWTHNEVMRMHTKNKQQFKQFGARPQMRRFGESNSGKVPHQKIVANGIEFDSKAEHDRYLELLIMQRAGLISELECHPSYEVLPKQETPKGKHNFRPVVYTPDFRYKDKDGKEIVEEVKSEYTRKEKDYVIRRKLLYFTQGIYVEEVVR